MNRTSRLSNLLLFLLFVHKCTDWWADLNPRCWNCVTQPSGHHLNTPIQICLAKQSWGTNKGTLAVWECCGKAGLAGTVNKAHVNSNWVSNRTMRRNSHFEDKAKHQQRNKSSNYSPDRAPTPWRTRRKWNTELMKSASSHTEKNSKKLNHYYSQTQLIGAWTLAEAHPATHISNLTVKTNSQLHRSGGGTHTHLIWQNPLGAKDANHKWPQNSRRFLKWLLAPPALPLHLLQAKWRTSTFIINVYCHNTLSDFSQSTSGTLCAIK